MNEFLPLRQSHFIEFLLKEIFNSLHIMVRHRFMLFYTECVSFGEILIYPPQPRKKSPGITCHLTYSGQLRERQFGQSNEILHFHLDTVANQSKF